METRSGETVRQEFHICVTPVGEDEYLLRTEQVAPGVPLAQELVVLPVEDWLMQAEQPVNSLGQQIYYAVFQGTIRDSWIRAQEIAQHQQELLHLRLGLQETRLARLPWEVLLLYLQPEFDGSLDITAELELPGEEDWEELLDEIEDEDPAYEQDAALVSDLFRQLANQATSAEPLMVPAEPLNQLTVATDANPDSESTVAPALALLLVGTKAFKGWIQHAKGNSRIVWVVLGVVGVVAIALLGVWWYQNRGSITGTFSPNHRVRNTQAP